MIDRKTRRKFGQNYLKDPAVLFEMGEAINPSAGDHFFEIGPGMGELTKTINNDGVNIYAMDVDPMNIDYLKEKIVGPANLNFKSILIIGLFQIFSLIPGVSRAGITMTAARILKFNRVDSSKISFLLSIPALSGASFLGLKDLFDQSVEFNYLVIIAIASSFIFSFVTVKFFLEYINKFSMNAFVIYRIIIALFLFFIIYF